jgi:hypothetical protein
MSASKRRGQQHIDGQSYHFINGKTKHSGGLDIGAPNDASPVGQDRGDGKQIKSQAFSSCKPSKGANVQSTTTIGYVILKQHILRM